MTKNWRQPPTFTRLAMSGTKWKEKLRCPPGIPKAFPGKYEPQPIELPVAVWYPGSQEFIRREERERQLAAVESAIRRLFKTRSALLLIADRAVFSPVWYEWRTAEARLQAAQTDLCAVEARLAADKVRFLAAAGDLKTLAKAASQAEREYRLAAAVVQLREAEQRRATAATEKPAEAEKLTAEVAAAPKQVAALNKALPTESEEYTLFSPIYPKQSSGRRLAFAKWLIAPENPLSARVAANHLWYWHFGQSIASPVFDLGRNGKPPIHPELLDWLAAELRNHNWQMKPIHRLIVTSQVYRLSSEEPPPSDPRRAIDPDNRAIWKFPIQRMEAEVVRDSLLYLAGQLDPQRGGPEVPLEQAAQSLRRSLYLTLHGEDKPQFLELFDAPDRCDTY